MPSFSRVVRPGGEGHPDDGVRRAAADALGEPEAVEAERLQCVDDTGEALVVEGGTNSEAVADADLHGPA